MHGNIISWWKLVQTNKFLLKNEYIWGKSKTNTQSIKGTLKALQLLTTSCV